MWADEVVVVARDCAEDDEGETANIAGVARRYDGSKGFEDGFDCFEGLV
jgi:hypothetical protein